MDTFNQAFENARKSLIEKYKLKFINGKAPIHKRVLNAYILNPRPFLDVGICCVSKKTASPKIAERGHFRLFTPTYGSKPITREALR